MRRVNIALCLALAAALWLPNGFSASGTKGSAGSHTTSVAPSRAGPNVHGSTCHGMPAVGSTNPVMLPAWSPSRSRSMGFSVSTGLGRRNDLDGEPGTIVLRTGGDSRTQSDPGPTVNNGGITNRRHFSGTVVAVRRARGARGTIQLRLTRDERPVINGKQQDQPTQDVTVHVSDATRFQARGHKGRISLADVHLGEIVRVGFDNNRIREVEVLATSGSGR